MFTSDDNAYNVPLLQVSSNNNDTAIPTATAVQTPLNQSRSDRPPIPISAATIQPFDIAMSESAAYGADGYTGNSTEGIDLQMANDNAHRQDQVRVVEEAQGRGAAKESVNREKIDLDIANRNGRAGRIIEEVETRQGTRIGRNKVMEEDKALQHAKETAKRAKHKEYGNQYDNQLELHQVGTPVSMMGDLPPRGKNDDVDKRASTSAADLEKNIYDNGEYKCEEYETKEYATKDYETQEYKSVYDD